MISYPISLRTFILGAVVAILFLSGWEMHWRSKGYLATPDDDKHLWAEQRALLDRKVPPEVVIIGSSRVLFDFQLNEWESVTGNRPVMLAAAGSNPIPVFKDIVENSDFAGTLIIGVTPPLFFSPLRDDNRSFRRIVNWVNHYHKRTYADRLNHQLAKLTQNSFAFLNSSEEGFKTELNLKVLIENIELPVRVPGPPRWPSLAYVDKDRNITMVKALESDTSYANQVTNFWKFVIQPPRNMPPPEVIEEGRKAMIALNKELVDKFKAKGGKIIYVRCPSQGMFYQVESRAFPKEMYWDPLVEAADCPSYYFEDYEFMNQYKLPEWSHLNTRDAKQFTLDLVRQMQKDGVL